MNPVIHSFVYSVTPNYNQTNQIYMDRKLPVFFKVGMPQCLLCSNPVFWIIDTHLVNEIYAFLGSTWQ